MTYNKALNSKKSLLLDKVIVNAMITAEDLINNSFPNCNSNNNRNLGWIIYIMGSELWAKIISSKIFEYT